MTIEQIDSIRVVSDLIDARLNTLAEDTKNVNGDYYQRQREMGSLYLLKYELKKLKDNS